MKILMIHKFYFGGGGADLAMLNTKALLEKQGHQVITFAMENANNYRTEYSKYFLSYLDFSGQTNHLGYKIRLLGRMLYSLEARKKVAKLIKAHKPDLAHIHNIYHQISPSILPVLKEQGIPMVMTLHDHKLLCPALTLVRGDGRLACEQCGGRRFYYAVKYKCVKNSYGASLACAIEMYFHRFANFYKLIDLWISPSTFLANNLIRHHLVDGANLKIISNFANDVGYVPVDPYAPLVYIGKMAQEKGVMVLLEAFLKIQSLQLLMVGDGPLLEKAHAFIRQNSMRNVCILGFVENSKINKLLEKSSALVLPALNQENAPVTILEAFAAGRPVIASRVGGIPELVKDGKTGYLVKPNDKNDLMAKINAMYKNPNLMAKMGKVCRETYESNFSEKIHYRELLKAYNSLIGVNKGQR